MLSQHRPNYGHYRNVSVDIRPPLKLGDFDGQERKATKVPANNHIAGWHSNCCTQIHYVTVDKHFSTESVGLNVKNVQTALGATRLLGLQQYDVVTARFKGGRVAIYQMLQKTSHLQLIQVAVLRSGSSANGLPGGGGAGFGGGDNGGGSSGSSSGSYPGTRIRKTDLFCGPGTPYDCVQDGGA